MLGDFSYAFVPFELDGKSRRLTLNGEAVAVPDRHIDILLALLSDAGEVISKEALGTNLVGRRHVRRKRRLLPHPWGAF